MKGGKLGFFTSTVTYIEMIFKIVFIAPSLAVSRTS